MFYQEKNNMSSHRLQTLFARIEQVNDKRRRLLDVFSKIVNCIANDDTIENIFFIFRQTGLNIDNDSVEDIFDVTDKLQERIDELEVEREKLAGEFMSLVDSQY